MTIEPGLRSERCQFTPAGLRVVCWSAEEQQYVDRVPDRLDLFLVLRLPVAIEAGTTLRHIMTVVRKDRRLTRFIGLLASCSGIREFHEELDLPSKPREAMKLVVRWRRVDVADSNEAPDLPASPELLGLVGANTYCLMVSEMWRIADCELLIDKTIQITFRDTGRIWNATRDMSVLDVLQAIYWEISWYGSPLQREAEVKRWELDEDR